MTRTMRKLVLAVGIALALASCGRKSDLQRPVPPPDVQKDATGKTADPARPFVLDPLLR